MPIETQDISLQDWFHGGISRSVAERRLTVNGEFLVRDCISDAGNYVLSCMWQERPMHFKVNRTRQSVPAIPNSNSTFDSLTRLQNLYHFEDESFRNVSDLINFYVFHQKKVTELSQAVLSISVKRPDPVPRLSNGSLPRANKLKKMFSKETMRQVVDRVSSLDDIYEETLVRNKFDVDNATPNSDSIKSVSSVGDKRRQPPNMPLPTLPRFSLKHVPVKPTRAPSLKVRNGQRPVVIIRDQLNPGRFTETSVVEGVPLASPDPSMEEGDDDGDDYCDIDYAAMDDIQPSQSQKSAGETEEDDLTPLAPPLTYQSSPFNPMSQSAIVHRQLITSPQQRRCYSNDDILNEGAYHTLSNDRDSACVLEEEGSYHSPAPFHKSTPKGGGSLENITQQQRKRQLVYADYDRLGPTNKGAFSDEIYERAIVKLRNVQQLAEVPVIELCLKSKIDLTSFECAIFDNNLTPSSKTNKALQENIWTVVKEKLLNSPIEVLCAAISLSDSQILTEIKHSQFFFSTGDIDPNWATNVDATKISLSSIGHALIFLPAGKLWRQDVMERCNVLRIFVALTVVFPISLEERCAFLARWINIAKMLREKPYCNFFALANIVDGLNHPQVKSMRLTWDHFRKSHTAESFVFETELRQFKMRLEKGFAGTAVEELASPRTSTYDVPRSKFTPVEVASDEIVYLQPVLNFFDATHRHDLPVFDWEESESEFAIESFGAHLMLVRSWLQVFDCKKYKESFSSCVGENGEFCDLVEMMQTEFLMRFLWGSGGAMEDKSKRYEIYQKILYAKASRAEVQETEM